MIMVDVNVLVYAFRVDMKQHEITRSWFEKKLNGFEPVGISELVLSGFMRLVTNSRVFQEPTSPEDALAYCDAIRSAPATISVRPGVRHWDIFAQLCRSVRARGNLIPDAFHAALAIETGATWISSDRDFAKFPDLRWELPES